MSMSEWNMKKNTYVLVLWRCMSIWTGVANKAETGGENQSSTSIEEQDEEEKGKPKRVVLG